MWRWGAIVTCVNRLAGVPSRRERGFSIGPDFSQICTKVLQITREGMIFWWSGVCVGPKAEEFESSGTDSKMQNDIFFVTAVLYVPRACNKCRFPHSLHKAFYQERRPYLSIIDRPLDSLVFPQ